MTLDEELFRHPDDVAPNHVARQSRHDGISSRNWRKHKRRCAGEIVLVAVTRGGAGRRFSRPAIDCLQEKTMVTHRLWTASEVDG